MGKNRTTLPRQFGSDDENNKKDSDQPLSKLIGDKLKDLNPKKLSVIALILLIIASMAAYNNLKKMFQTDIEYSRFKELVDDGTIKEVQMSQSFYYGYTYLTQSDTPSSQGVNPLSRSGSNLLRSQGGPIYKAIPIQDASFIPLLESKGVLYSAMPPSNNFFRDYIITMLFPLFIIILIWRFFLKKAMGGNVMNFGQSRSKIVAENDIETRFTDVAGCDESKDELIEVVEFLKHPQKYSEIGGKIPRGVLLVGPPGTGKTLISRAVAGEAGVTFFQLSGAEFVEMFVGVGAARVRDLFKQAREKAPCIVFIDELDAVGRSRTNSISSNDEREQTLNQLLVEMDGFDSTAGVIILAATNRPEILDPALLRPGRFDRQVLVDKPDLIGREDILKIHAKGIKLSPKVDLKEIAKNTPGFVGADLANIVNEAALHAVRNRRKVVVKEDFYEAIEKNVIGLQLKNKLINAREREIIAYHEIGHALVALLTPNSDPLQKVSIIPRGHGALGFTLQTPEEEKLLVTESQLIGEIDILLGGRAAEKVIYDTISTGASNDITRATDVARRMMTQYGMSDKFHNMALTKRAGNFMEGQQKEYSEATQQYVDEVIADLIDQRYNHVLDVLKKHKSLLGSVVEELLEKEDLEAEEFISIVSRSPEGEKALEERKKLDFVPSQLAKESGERRDKKIHERKKRQNGNKGASEKRVGKKPSPSV